MRNDMSLRYIAPSDLDSKDVLELKKVLEHVLTQPISHQASLSISDLLKILTKDNLDGRFAWIESMQDGTKTIKSVPEDIGELLADRLYDFTSTTLLIPPSSEKTLATIVPDRISASVASSSLPPPVFSLKMPVGISVETALHAPQGKTIVLVPSKRVIEDLFVRHTENLEEEGVTLLCQGFSGGAGRMQAEFLLASAPVVMVMTPWMYEGIDLEPEAVDRLVMQTMPFDHPSHPVVSRRAERCKSPFNEYSLPRLRHRLFRLLRTFSRHAKTGAVFEILDDRLRTKAYGKQVAEYLESMFVSESSSTKKATKGSGEGQMSLL
jgi:hypothetical protein